MNYLAHSLFCESNDHILVGQYCGDFVRGNDLAHFPEGVQSGIRLHREIDKYTDRHPQNLQARALFQKPYRRFAGIIIDVLYDHYLASNWHRYCDIPLTEHADFVYTALDRHFDLLPPDLQRFARRTIESRVLESYTDIDSVSRVLALIARRSERFNVLENTAIVIEENGVALERSFKRFFPDLQAHIHLVTHS